MIGRLANALSLVAVLAVPALGQTGPQLPLPAPTPYRASSGRPGHAYWQQRLDYRITATLDTATHELRGRELIRYTNNSPDALSYLWMFLEQNICSRSGITEKLDQPPLMFLGSTFDFSCKEFDGGVTLEHVRIGGQELRPAIYGTTMRIDLPRPLASGRMLDLDIAWRFTVPPYGAGRMGRDGSLYQIAQWYPRLAVYDDVRGWNHDPYIGAGEFYLEYGSFDVSLTLPSNYTVAATGTLRNPELVLTPEQRSRLAGARSATEPVPIITSVEAGKVGTPARTATWRFTADSVRDFAFAAGSQLRWDASAYGKVLIHTLYRPSAPEWEEANRMVRDALQYFSEQWYPYPYSHITSVEGPIEGMEYPMLTFDPRAPSREERQWVLAHELGHQWMPMIVGSNERLYPWMDEGFNTFIDLAGAARYFAGTAYGDSIEVHPLHLYQDHAIPGEEQPLITRPVEVKDLFWTGYQKPALMMQTCAMRCWEGSASMPRSAPTYGHGPINIQRRPISSVSCAMHRGWIWTGTGEIGCSPRPGSIRRWTLSAGLRTAKRFFCRTGAPCCCRSKWISHTGTARESESGCRWRCGIRDPNSRFGSDRPRKSVVS